MSSERIFQIKILEKYKRETELPYSSLCLKARKSSMPFSKSFQGTFKGYSPAWHLYSELASSCQKMLLKASLINTLLFFFPLHKRKLMGNFLIKEKTLYPFPKATNLNENLPEQ